jgi:hypothetical protein
MKVLAVLLLAIAPALLSLTATAASLEIGFGAGPAAISLGSLNASIGVFNALITHLNETFETHPDVTGFVEPLAAMVSGLSMQAGEGFWLTDWFGLAAAVEYFRTSTGTVGHYAGSTTSTIDVSADLAVVSVRLGARATFLDMGLRLAADAAAGYHHVVSNTAVVFEIPEEYPDTISGVPPSGVGRYTGDTFGFELGLSLVYPVSPWVSLGASIGYRSATVPTIADAAGSKLDLDGDGTPEAIDLDGISVRLTLAFSFDLSSNEEKE